MSEEAYHLELPPKFRESIICIQDVYAERRISIDNGKN
jgi:hypothetical protein